MKRFFYFVSSYLHTFNPRNIFFLSFFAYSLVLKSSYKLTTTSSSYICYRFLNGLLEADKLFSITKESPANFLLSKLFFTHALAREHSSPPSIPILVHLEHFSGHEIIFIKYLCSYPVWVLWSDSDSVRFYVRNKWFWIRNTARQCWLNQKLWQPSALIQKILFCFTLFWTFKKVFISWRFFA